MYFSVDAGGGTVMFVLPDGTPQYSIHEEEREEGGTPNIVGCIRYVTTVMLRC